jgi:hypothetical protein
MHLLRGAQARADKPRQSSTPLEKQTKASLLKEARSHDINGLSSLSKAENVTALQGK